MGGEGERERVSVGGESGRREGEVECWRREREGES